MELTVLGGISTVKERRSKSQGAPFSVVEMLRGSFLRERSWGGAPPSTGMMAVERRIETGPLGRARAHE